MRLIESILARSQDAVVCRARIPADYPAASAGQAPAVISVEIAAQASALLAPEPISGRTHAPSATADGRVGYLVSARRVTFSCHSLPVGVPLLVRAIDAGRAGPLQMVGFELIQETDAGIEVDRQNAELLLAEGLPADSALASGTLGTFESEHRVGQ